MLGLYHWELRWGFSISNLSFTPYSYAVYAFHCRGQGYWDLWMLDIFHKATFSFPQLCSQLSLPHSAGLLTSWCCSRVRKGTNIIWEKVLVLTELWILREHKKLHLYKIQSWWLYMNLIMGMVRYPDCQCSKTWRRRRSVWQPGEVGLDRDNGRGFAVMESECPKFTTKS